MTDLSLQSSHLILPKANRDALQLEGLTALRGRFNELFDYPDTQGDSGLREDIERITPNWDGDTLITSSATQALSLALNLVGRGKKLALYVPSYFAAIRQANELNQEIKTWSTVEELESLGDLDVVLVTSNHTPPSGTSFTNEEKERIASVAQKNKSWLIEDNAYEPLWFDHAPKPIKADPNKTIRVGSLSKIAGPGFRLGFIKAKEEVLKQLRSMKITSELSTPLLSQVVVRPALRYDELQILRDELHRRSDRLREGLNSIARTEIPKPDGGPYLKLALPARVEPKELQACTASRGLKIDTNEHQYPDGRQRDHIRLHCGAIEKANIDQAVEILEGSINEVQVK